MELRYTQLLIRGGPHITCQKNSGSLEGSNKSAKPCFIILGPTNRYSNKKKGMWPSCVERYTPKPVSQ
jgi:hypothetical protein